MVKFVFDLDLTLYSEKDCKDTECQRVYYNSFKEKNFLKQLLKTIPYTKYILTNANYLHAEDVLKRLGIFNEFKGILSSDMFADEDIKPSLPIYIEAIKHFKIKSREVVYFFEDQPDNLKTAKEKLKWNTVLICPEPFKKPSYIDYVFKTIEEALLFFIVRDKFRKI